MGSYIQSIPLGTVTYIDLDGRALRKVLSTNEYAPFCRFAGRPPFGKEEIFFDTPKNILSKTGILLSKVNEQGRTYFKIQRQSFLPKSYQTEGDMQFIHEVGAKDKILDHYLYLLEGITSVFGSTFNIDLENILKNVKPILQISSKVQSFELISGTGFRANVLYYNNSYFNAETKRKFKCDMLTITCENVKNYLSQFQEYLRVLEKHCKSILPISESTFDYGERVTQKIVAKPKVVEKEKKKS